MTMQLRRRESASARSEIEEPRSPGLSDTGQDEESGLTLEEYAREKGLPIDFLTSLGISQIPYGSGPALRIPYLGAGDEEVAVRFRIALDGDRFRWESGSKLCSMAKTGSQKPTGLDTWCWSKGSRTATPSGTTAFPRLVITPAPARHRKARQGEPLWYR
jgi:hypothetical protein